MPDTLTVAREAFDGRAWEEAREAFALADDDDGLSPADLELLADAAWWSGHPDQAVDSLERAYTAYLEDGSNVAAALVAMKLAYFALRRLSPSVATGWKGQAERLLADEPESPAIAWLEFVRMAEALFVQGDYEEAFGRGEHALELARKLGVRDVEAQVLGFKGYAMVRTGHWKEGMALMDEATAAAMSGEIELRTACDVYCQTISCCSSMGDYGRAGEWTETADRWMQRNSLGGYPGECRVHRAALKKLRGSYPEAERMIRVACDELERYRLLDAVGFAYHELAEVKLRMGDLEAAEEAFMRAYENGSTIQPGFSLLQLARGEVEEAHKALSSALDAGWEGVSDSVVDQAGRAKLLPAQVTVSLAAGDVESAQKAAEELEEIAAQYEQPAFEAAAMSARGAVLLQIGQLTEAESMLDRAWRRWREIGFPHESAQARTMLGQAKAAAGDNTTARMEFKSARSAFERLGATLDLKRVDELLGEEAVSEKEGAGRVARTFMFTDIVTSTDLIELVGDEAWEDLMRWHDRALRSEFSKHGGQEVRQTGDGFFVAFEESSDAVEAAVSIQRRLTSHRREHGFAPWVRIGIHAADATPVRGDYSGHGVHVAARVGDLGKREEIVVSADALELAGSIRFPVSEERSVNLKGVEEPIQVHTVDWR